MTLVAAALLPLAIFGLLQVLLGTTEPDSGLRILFFALAATAALGILVGHVLAVNLAKPLRALSTAAARVSAGEHADPVQIPGGDLLAQLADRQNRLGADVERRNHQLAEILASVATVAPSDGVEALLARAATDVATAFGLIDASVSLEDPATAQVEERIPGDPLPVRTELRAGTERLGLIRGHLPATSSWEPADQALLDLFGREVGVAVRNAQLFAQVEVQNAQLRGLAEAKDDFLRGVSHNLQTPLTSIRLYGDQLAGATGDRRAEIVVEQADRLSRMVRQLLIVSRLESGTIRPRSEVIALASRVRRAWEALAIRDRELHLIDEGRGWLAIGDADQLDQVLWALLDNAVKHGAGPIETSVTADAERQAIHLRVADHGRGVAPDDADRLFQRFARGSSGSSVDGSGLGLYVARALAAGMQGELVLESTGRREADEGAVFRLTLPAEPGLES
jgi:signal transduction histidine kinase